CAVHRSEAIGIDLHDVPQNVTPTAQVEIGMLSQINDRVLVGRGAVLKLQGIVFAQGVDCRDRQVSGVPLLPIVAQISQCQLWPQLSDLGLSHFTYDFVEPYLAPMQAVRSIVGGEAISNAIQRESAVRDAIAVAPDQGAEVRAVLEITCERVVTQ